MSENSSNNIHRKPFSYTWQKVVGLLLWVAVGFIVAKAILTLVAFALSWTGISLELVNQSVLQAIFAALVYIVTLIVVLGVPWWIRKSRTSQEELGLTRLPSWLDIGLAPAGFIIYLIVTAIFTTIATALVPGFDITQSQETGFANLSSRYEYVLAFVTLVVLAPVAEEILFRGYLFGKLRKYLPAWVAIILTSVLFGVVHGQWNVGVDVFALSLVLCSLREITGSIWAGILLHMMKNALAFYLLFINPSLLNIMGG